MARFITLEGGEGSGKSTQCKLLAEAMREAGLKVLLTREPGGTRSAEQLRDLLLQGDAERWDAKAETLLFYAARLEHVNKVIKPALADGTYVICDRFADSTFVYQGIAKGIEAEWINRLHRLCLDGFTPDLTLLMDIPPETGLGRAQQRHGNETRFEDMGLAFHTAVREGFIARARAENGRCLILDATPAAQEVHQSVLQAVNQRLGLTLSTRAA